MHRYLTAYTILCFIVEQVQHRYYIGLQLPKELRARIAQIQQSLFDPVLARPLEPHITLLPPPAVERLEPEELGRQAKITAEPFWPLKLTLDTIETYQGHTLAIGVKSEAMYTLQKQLVALLPPGAETMDYPNTDFTPHVTLARVRRGQAMPADLQQHFSEQLASLLPTTFEVTRLTLFRWERPQTYTAIPL